MKIHLKQIPAQGLHLEGEENCPIQELEAGELRCAGPLRYQLEVGLSEGALWANGLLEQPVELQCVACLENFRYSIKVPAFALHLELHGPEAVDLAPLMREDLLLNLPAHPHCDRDGQRQCSGAMAGHETAAEKQEQEARREHDWEALDRLKIEKR